MATRKLSVKWIHGADNNLTTIGLVAQITATILHFATIGENVAMLVAIVDQMLVDASLDGRRGHVGGVDIDIRAFVRLQVGLHDTKIMECCHAIRRGNSLGGGAVVIAGLGFEWHQG